MWLTWRPHWPKLVLHTDNFSGSQRTELSNLTEDLDPDLFTNHLLHPPLPNHHQPHGSASWLSNIHSDTTLTHAVLGLLGPRRVVGQPLRPVVKRARSDTRLALPVGLTDRFRCVSLQFLRNPSPGRCSLRVQRVSRELDLQPRLPYIRRYRFQVPRSSWPVRYLRRMHLVSEKQRENDRTSD